MTTTRGIANNIKRPDFFVMQQIQRQLSSDMAWIVTGIFLITVIESAQIMNTSPITVFSIIYECVSAFANVGASLGYPNTSTSQAASYHTLSKLIVIALMYRGRHRGTYMNIMRYRWGYSILIDAFLIFQVCRRQSTEPSYFHRNNGNKLNSKTCSLEGEPRVHQ
jgi:Trk-type K+ transport system membrane component